VETETEAAVETETEAAVETAATVTMRTVENGESGGNGKESGR
jgi:hypothetical protein